MSAGRDNTLRVWDVESGRQLIQLDGPAGAPGFKAACFLPDGETAISVTPSGSLQLWNLGKRALVASRKCSDTQVRGLAVSPDGSLAATCGTDGTIHLWSLPAGHPGQRD
jgi:WD40 repeat protein